MQNKWEATFRQAHRGFNKDKLVLNIVEDFLGSILWVISLCLLISAIKNLFWPQQKQAIHCI